MTVPRQTLLCAAALLCLLAACDNSTADAGGRGTDGPATTSPARSQPTLPSTKPTTRPVTTTEGPCPYVDTATVMNTIGQHLARSTVTSTRPHPSCAFYRPDGGLAAQITVSEEPNPVAAQNLALERAGQSANPVDGIGDYGAVTITDEGALLAVTKARTLVVVQINQKSSLQAKEIARIVVGKL
jgi:hypothetical protein